MLNRSAPHAPPTFVFTDTEIGLLDHLVKNKGQTPTCDEKLFIIT